MTNPLHTTEWSIQNLDTGVVPKNNEQILHTIISVGSVGQLTPLVIWKSRPALEPSSQPPFVTELKMHIKLCQTIGSSHPVLSIATGNRAPKHQQRASQTHAGGPFKVNISTVDTWTYCVQNMFLTHFAIASLTLCKLRHQYAYISYCGLSACTLLILIGQCCAFLGLRAKDMS